MSAHKDYLALPLREFLTDLGEKSPTPGGGSVAALTGALSASLARMAVAYTLGRKDASQHQSRLEELSGELHDTMKSFCQLVQEDMAAYETFAATRRTGKPAEQQQAILRAIAVPMEIIVLAGAVAAWADEIKSFVNRYLLSDLQAAVELEHELRDLQRAREADDQQVIKADFAELVDQHRVQNAECGAHQQAYRHDKVPGDAVIEKFCQQDAARGTDVAGRKVDVAAYNDQSSADREERINSHRVEDASDVSGF